MQTGEAFMVSIASLELKGARSIVNQISSFPLPPELPPIPLVLTRHISFDIFIGS